MDTVSFINHYSTEFMRFSSTMLWQSSVLILILLLINFVLRKWVKAVFRYCLWMLLLVKLVLPVGLALPSSPAYWVSWLVPKSETTDIPQATQSESEPTSTVVSAYQSIPSLPTTVPPAVPIPTKYIPSTETTTIPTLPSHNIPGNVPLPQTQTNLSWISLVSFGWLVAVVVMMGLLVQRAFFVRGLIRQSKPANDNLLSQLRQCARKLNMRQSIDIRLSPNAASPSVCGLMRPVILIPDDLPAQLGTGQIEAVLMHELAHIKRGDLWINLVQALQQIAYFYNPLLWLANTVIRRTREQAVDEMVLVAMDDHAERYAETLLSVSKLVWSKPMLSLRLIGVVESKSALTGRIRLILNRPFPKSARLGTISVLTLFMTAAVLLPMAKAEPDRPGFLSRNTTAQLEVKDTSLAPHAIADDTQTSPMEQPRDEMTRSVFLNAVREGNLLKVKQYISKGFDINATNRQGTTALHEAGPWGQTDIAKYLIESGANIHQKDTDGQTPLFAAASYSHQAEPTAKLLLDHGAAVNLSDNRGMSPLHYASTASMCKMLIEKGADIHARDKRGWTSLHYDANWGRLSAVDYLIENGANIDAQDNEGRTPLILASTNANSKVVEHLLKRKAGFSALDQQGRTPLHWAVIKDSDQIKELLNGQQANGGQSRSAVEKHYLKIVDTVKLLLAKGTDPYIEDLKDLTALDYARLASNQRAAAILSASDDIQTKQNDKKANSSEFAVTLPCGITVELFGICQMPENGRRENWRKPDGAPLRNRPFSHSTWPSRYKYDNKKWYNFVFSISGQNKYKRSSRPSPRMSIKNNFGVGTATLVGKETKYINTLNCTVALLPVEMDTAEIQFGFQDSPWKIVAKATDGPAEIILEGRYLKVTPLQYENEKLIVRTYEDFRQFKDKHIGFVLIYEKDGQDLIRSLSRYDSDMRDDYERGIRKETYEIDLSRYDDDDDVISADMIKGSCIRYYEYEHATFKNVSLRPLKTNVHIEVHKTVDDNFGWKELILPERDGSMAPAIQALDTHERIPIQDDSDQTAHEQWIHTLRQTPDRSYLFYDYTSNKASLGMVKGLQFLGIDTGSSTQHRPIVQILNKTLPYPFFMTAPDGQVYEFAVLQADSKSCQLRYRLHSNGKKNGSNEKTGLGPVDFEGYFPDSTAGTEALTALWNDPKKDTKEPDVIIETARKGLRRHRGNANILRWVGNLFIWGKNPQNPKAIELMYHASGSPNRGLYGDAVYFGLSVTKNKTPEILQAMAAVAMKTEDYYNVTGRILWGCKNHKEQLMACLGPYLSSDDPAIRQKAEDVRLYFGDSKAFMAERARQHQEAVRKEHASNLNGYKRSLLHGDSGTRMEMLKLFQAKDVMSIIDESFLDALEACVKDNDARVRDRAAWVIGQKYIWGAVPQHPRAIEMLIPLLNDSHREVRGTAVYFGLSTVHQPDKALLTKTLATILDDREVNYYGRVIWGAKRNKQATKEILNEWIGQTQDTKKAIKAYEIYEDVLQQPLDGDRARRFADKKSDVHEGLVAMVMSAKPTTMSEMLQQFVNCLDTNKLLTKFSDFYMMENQQTVVGMFLCDTLTDRNAIRRALKEGPEFNVAGYIDGRSGPTGSGWIRSLDAFKKRNEPYRVKSLDMIVGAINKANAYSEQTQPPRLSPPIIAHEVKLNFANPSILDKSFHSKQSVAFVTGFIAIDIGPGKLVTTILSVGQTTWSLGFKGDHITIGDGSTGHRVLSEPWPVKQTQFDKVVTLPVTYGQHSYACPVHLDLVRRKDKTPMVSYWYCAYLSGRLPWGAGGRLFEIVNLDQQMEFRLTGDGGDKRDAVLGIDIDGSGTIDTKSEQFDLYEPFQIGNKTYRVSEIDPYMPRVVFREVDPGKTN
jgi:ankyrin repeat protein/beta-lactamase regulating signal transducer with metallopeptidase domain